MILRNSHYSENTLAFFLTGAVLKASKLDSYFDELFSQKLPAAHVRASLSLLSARGESADELISAWKAIRRIETKKSLKLTGALDTCGTGGDGSHSLNLSTLSSVVMAACGVRVLKHGNRAITSRCGSSDLLESLGMNLAQSCSSTLLSAKTLGMGYFHAPNIHPVYAAFQSLRKSIRIRTLFNLLGPVLNPVCVDYQILGVAQKDLQSIYSALLPKMGRKKALIVTGACGMDEITSLGNNSGLVLNGETKKSWHLSPSQFGFKIGNKKDLEIRSVQHAKQMTIDILVKKKKGTAYDSIVLSSACGIWLSGHSLNLADAVTAAHRAIASGKAWSKLQQITDYSNK